jgi:hypothetical protein
MAKKKVVVTLEHRAFGKVTLKSSFFLASSGAKFFTVLTDQGEKKLLASPEYWLSSREEIEKQFNLYSAKALLAEKTQRAADRKRDRDSAAAKSVSRDKKLKMQRLDEAELEELQIETEPEHAESDEQAFAASE